MKNAVANLFRASLIPELGSDVTAGTARYVEIALVGVAAIRALPDMLAILVIDDFDLAVVAALLAVVALDVNLRI